MPRYIFDVHDDGPADCYIFDLHDDGPADWGNETLEGAGRDEIEQRARQLIEEAQTRQAERRSRKVTTTLFVHPEGGGIILTAYGRAGENLRLIWTP